MVKATYSGIGRTTPFLKLWHDRIFGIAPFTRLWHPQFLVDRQLRLQVSNDLPKQSGLRLLDIGCGKKPYRYLRPDSHWYGIDIYPGADVDQVIEPGTDWLLEDWNYDVILLTQVLEHVKEPSELMGKIVRSAIPGTLLIVNSPFIYPFHGLPYDYQRFTEEYFRSIFPDNVSLEMKQLGGIGSSLATLINNWIHLSIPTGTLGKILRLLTVPIVMIVYSVNNMLGLLLDWFDATHLFPTNISLTVKL